MDNGVQEINVARHDLTKYLAPLVHPTQRRPPVFLVSLEPVSAVPGDGVLARKLSDLPLHRIRKKVVQDFAALRRMMAVLRDHADIQPLQILSLAPQREQPRFQPGEAWIAMEQVSPFQEHAAFPGRHLLNGIPRAENLLAHRFQVIQFLTERRVPDLDFSGLRIHQRSADMK